MQYLVTRTLLFKVSKITSPFEGNGVPRRLRTVSREKVWTEMILKRPNDAESAVVIDAIESSIWSDIWERIYRSVKQVSIPVITGTKLRTWSVGPWIPVWRGKPTAPKTPQVASRPDIIGQCIPKAQIGAFFGSFWFSFDSLRLVVSLSISSIINFPNKNHNFFKNSKKYTEIMTLYYEIRYKIFYTFENKTVSK